jgi:hypothetical protein
MNLFYIHRLRFLLHEMLQRKETNAADRPVAWWHAFVPVGGANPRPALAFDEGRTRWCIEKNQCKHDHGTQDLGPRPTGAATAHCGTCASSTTTTATSCRTMCTPWRPAPPLPRSCRPPPRTRSPAGAPHGRAGPGSFYAVDLGLGINLVILNPSVGHDSCRTSGARARMKPFSEWRLEDR